MRPASQKEPAFTSDVLVAALQRADAEFEMNISFSEFLPCNTRQL